MPARQHTARLQNCITHCKLATTSRVASADIDRLTSSPGVRSVALKVISNGNREVIENSNFDFILILVITSSFLCVFICFFNYLLIHSLILLRLYFNPLYNEFVSLFMYLFVYLSTYLCFFVCLLIH
jgi:hypothetical protein